MNAALHKPQVHPEAVLTKATVRAAEGLGLHNADLARIIGVSDSTVSRYKTKGAGISPTSKPGELALMLIRVFRSLDPLVGSDNEMRKAWMHSDHQALGGVPAKLIRHPEGLVRTLAYLAVMVSAGSAAATSSCRRRHQATR